MSYINNTAGYEAFTNAAAAIDFFLRECAECANPIPLKDWASFIFFLSKIL